MIGDWTTQQQALVYTPAQQERVKAGVPQAQSLEQFWASINVTPEQEARLRAIHQESQRRMKAVAMGNDP
jgi:Spy/CpxP family protein refolding chaperone